MRNLHTAILLFLHFRSDAIPLIGHQSTPTILRRNLAYCLALWRTNEQADEVMQTLFDLQNESGVAVCILSGDIHTSGYGTIYSNDGVHAERPSIPHVTSSSVSYKPFKAIYRHASKTVLIGKSQKFYAQVSDHFFARSIAVLSIRPSEEGQQLKVKYYLEGFPKPQILLFDLGKTSHRENIDWIAAEEIYGMSRRPSKRGNHSIMARRSSTCSSFWARMAVSARVNAWLSSWVMMATSAIFTR